MRHSQFCSRICVTISWGTGSSKVEYDKNEGEEMLLHVHHLTSRTKWVVRIEVEISIYTIVRSEEGSRIPVAVSSGCHKPVLELWVLLDNKYMCLFPS